MKLFDVVAQEEQTIGQPVEVELTAADLIALEEANEAVAQVDALETTAEEAIHTAVAMEEVAALEEAMLEDPAAITVATAKLSAVQTAQLAAQVGAQTQVAVEEITDPVRTLTVSLEEKRNIAKKIYDAAVLMLKKLVNAAKKAFAKIVMAVAGNKGLLEKTEKALKENTFSEIIFDKTTSEETAKALPGYMLNKNIVGLAGIINGIRAVVTDDGKWINSEKVISLAKKSGEDAYKELEASKAHSAFENAAKYIANSKDKLFGGENLSGDFTVKVVSVGPKYWRVILSGMTGEGENTKPWVKYKKVSAANPDVKGIDGKIDVKDLIDMISEAKTANDGLKKFTDDAFKASDDALKAVEELAKKADKGEEVDTLSVTIEKAMGSVAYGRAIDRYKAIKNAGRVAFNIVSKAKPVEEKKEDK